jgi:hypothetical protein
MQEKFRSTAFKRNFLQITIPPEGGTTNRSLLRLSLFLSTLRKLEQSLRPQNRCSN